MRRWWASGGLVCLFLGWRAATAFEVRSDARIADVRHDSWHPGGKQPTSFSTVDFLLSKGSAGHIVLGMSMEELRKVVDPRFIEVVDRNHNRTPYSQVIVHLDDEYEWKESLVAELSSGTAPTIQRIFVNDKRFQTEKGIRIGSSLGDLRRAYRNLRFQEADEGSWLVAYVDSLGMGFTLDSPTRDYVGETEAMRIPDEMTIVYICVSGR